MVIVFERIKKLLLHNGCSFELFEHAHVHTSEDAAKVRGTKLEEAAKALVLKEKVSGNLCMFIVAGNRKLDLKVIKKDILQVKNVSLAHPDEVLSVTGCPVGSVPPFGNLFGLPVFFDEHFVRTQEFMVFSAGTHTDSIKMSVKDFLEVVKADVRAYSVEK